MKSSICSPRTIRKLFLVGAVLLSTCTLQSTLVLATCVLQANPSQTRFSIKLQNATLEEFVKQMEQKTGYSFIYGEEVRLNSRITLAVRDLTINEILRKAFEMQPIGFEISGKHILLHKRPMPQKTVSRRFTISGYVTDGASSETLIGANVLDSRQRVGTATNPFGFYTLTLPEGDAELSFSYLGYETQHSSFPLNQDTVLNIRLNTNNELAEVIILSDKKEAGIQATAMGAHEIPMAQIQHTPAVLGEADILKTIQLMPGVQAGTEGFSGLYVRGGGPDQNLILLDGIPIYNADHLLGVFSIFTPEAVKKVTLFKSSFPARYGGRLSSIVDVRTNDGDMKRYHGALSIGTLTDKIHLEGPIIKDRTSFSLSGRGTHTAFLSNLFTSDGESYNYYFYDLNAKVNHKFSDRSRLFLGFYHGKDHYHFSLKEDYTYGDEGSETYQKNNYNDKTSLNWGNTIVSGRWNYVFNNKLFSNTTIAFNSYRMQLRSKSIEHRIISKEQYGFQYHSDYRSGIRDWSFRTDFDYTPIPAHHIKFGVEYLYHTFRPETTTSKMKEEENGEIGQDTLYHGISNSYLHGHEVSIYAEDNFDIGSRTSINAGVHFSLFNTQGKNYFSAQPRVSVRYRFDHDFSVKASFSQMAQYVHQLSSTPLAMPTDLWVPITKNIRPMFSNQYSIGGYYTGIPGWEFSVEGYYKRMRNVLEYQNGVSFFGSSTNWEDKVEMGKGRSMGIEFMAQKTMGKTTGWLAYTLAKADRQFKEGGINNGERFPYKYDRRHNISLSLNHKFNERIDVGASWVFNSGGTATIPEQQTVIIKPDGSITQANYISRRNNYRLPSSHRLNLGINFNKKTKHGMRIWNISIYNAYNAMNPTLIYTKQRNSDYYMDKYYENQYHNNKFWYQSDDGNMYEAYDKTKIVIKKLTLLPIIPSVTYTYKF